MSQQFEPSEISEIAKALGLGETGRHPAGKFDKNDEGELRFAVIEHRGCAVLLFGKSVAWLAMYPDQALQMGNLITNTALAMMSRGDGKEKMINGATNTAGSASPAPHVNLNAATTITDEQLNSVMNYHPWDEDKIQKGNLVRNALGNALRVIIENVPPCADRSVAIRKLREARMDANSAITHDGKY